jgi:phosphoenolpyruvate carboxykinase (GTP)
VPPPFALDTQGLDFTPEDMRIATKVDVDEWRAELPLVTEWFEQFGDKLPGVLWAELDALRARLDGEAAQQAGTKQAR